MLVLVGSAVSWPTTPCPQSLNNVAEIRLPAAPRLDLLLFLRVPLAAVGLGPVQPRIYVREEGTFLWVYQLLGMVGSDCWPYRDACWWSTR
jgi:hypothetical protein